MITILPHREMHEKIKIIIQNLWFSEEIDDYSSDQFSEFCRDKCGIKLVQFHNTRKWAYEFEDEEALTLFLLRYS